jgi:hypothetical protein
MTDAGPRMMPRQAPPATNGHRAQQRLGSPLSTRQRPRGYAALAVALIVGLGALGYWFYSQAGAKVPVVVAVHDIPAGHVIARSDLSTVEVAGGVTAVAGGHLSSLVGHTAAVEILPDTLVQRAMVTNSSPLATGQGLAGVAAAPGQIPSSGLAPGDTVEVLALPDKGGSASGSSGSSPVLVPSATVYDVRANPSAAGGTLLTLMVPTSSAFAVESASNAGLIALVKVGG